MRYSLLLLAVIALMVASLAVANAEQCPGVIVEPTWATPYAVKPGSTFTLKLKSVEAVEVLITNGTLTYKLSLKPAGGRAYSVQVPSDVPPGLYDLVVRVSDGRVCGEHGAVWVIGELDRLVALHTTDTHIGVVTFRPAENYILATIILALSNPEVNVVIHTGDLADTATAEQYAMARHLYALLDKPIFVIPGNHDHVTGSKNYVTYVGPLNWVRRVGPITLVGVDSGYEGYISTEQAKWVYATVMNGSNVVILVHHPLFAYVYNNIPHEFTVGNADELLKLLETRKPGSRYPYIYTSWLENREGLKILVNALYEGDVEAVLAGHIHVDSYALVHRADGSSIHFITTTTTGGPVREGDYHGVRIVVFDANGVKGILGAAEPWSRHASYSIEGLLAYLVESPNVTAMVVKVEDPRLLDLLPKLRLAVPLSRDMVNASTYELGLGKPMLRCTPVACVAYASTTGSPKLGDVYVLAFYQVPDHNPPTVSISAPDTIAYNKPIPIEVRVSDDAWGVAFVELTVKAGEHVYRVAPPIVDGKVVLNLPPLGRPGEVVINVTVYDASGKRATASKTIKVVKPATTTPTTTTATTTEEAKAIPIEEQAKKITTTTAVTTVAEVEETIRPIELPPPPTVERITVSVTITGVTPAAAATMLIVMVAATAAVAIAIAYVLRRG